MSTIIKWDFIPLEYEYKRADYIWEMPPPLAERPTPFINEWSPPIEVAHVPLEWTQVVVADPMPPIEPTQLEASPEPVETIELWDIPKPSDLLESHMQRAVNKAFENIGQYIGEAFVQLGKDLGMWILKVMPDTFGMIAMILCLGAIMSIPRTGKWAVISVSLAVLFEILRRLTI
jgi:hypothetical protein